MATIPCICPPTADGPRHPDGDTVTFRPSLGYAEARAVRKMAAYDIDSDDPTARGALVLAHLVDGYLMFGIESWTLVDEAGKPLPVTHANIRAQLLSRSDIAEQLGDEADDLYEGAIVLPLLRRGLTSLPDTPTPSTPSPQPESTSPPTGSPTPLRKPSKRSSTTTSPTAGTEPITSSPDGGSSSSQNSASAA